MTIFPWVIDAALWLQEQGHEVGLHYDLIPLWRGTGLPPGDALDQMLTFLREKGVHILGATAHGSGLCKVFGAANSELFAGNDNYQELYSRKNKDIILLGDGLGLPLFNLKPKDFGLNYTETYSHDFDIKYSDSNKQY